MSERQSLLRKVQEAEFSLIDTVLFLDTHPKDAQALEYYDKCRRILEKARAEFTERFGPLTNSEVNSYNRFLWVDDPWPWEVEE